MAAQYKKPVVREALLRAAREEFEAFGFRGASLRDIATKAGCSLSNIYSYFQSKDALFRAVLEPTVELIDRTFEMGRTLSYEAGDRESAYRMKSDLVERGIAFLDAHRADLKLLAFGAAGSSLEDFMHGVFERWLEMYKYRWNSYKENNPRMLTREFSEFFWYVMTKFTLSTTVEMLRRDMSRYEMISEARNLLQILHFGTQTLMRREGE